MSELTRAHTECVEEYQLWAPIMPCGACLSCVMHSLNEYARPVLSVDTVGFGAVLLHPQPAALVADVTAPSGMFSCRASHDILLKQYSVACAHVNVTWNGPSSWSVAKAITTAFVETLNLSLNTLWNAGQGLSNCIP